MGYGLDFAKKMKFSSKFLLVVAAVWGVAITLSATFADISEIDYDGGENADLIFEDDAYSSSEFGEDFKYYEAEDELGYFDVELVIEYKDESELGEVEANDIENEEFDADADEAEDYQSVVALNSRTVTNMVELMNAVTDANAGDINEIIITSGINIVGTAGFTPNFPTFTYGANVVVRGGNPDTIITVGRAEGFQVNAGANVVFEDLIIDGQNAGIRTAIRPQGGHVTTRNVEITGFTNSAIRADGGGANGSVLVLEAGTHIHNNNLTTGSGAGIALNNSRVYMNDGVVIEHNTAPTNGGGIVIGGENANYVGHLEMSGGIIQHNTATSGAGGGIQLAAGRTFNMTGGLIYDNNAGTTGGGIHLPTGPVVNISGNAQIIDNTAGTQGGGVFAQRPLIIGDNVIISDNTAAQGGGIRTNQSVTLNGNVSITNNTSNTSGGGIHTAGGTASAVTMNDNSSITGNRATTTGGGIASTEGGAITMNGTASITNNRTAGNGGGIQIAGAVNTAVLTMNEAAQVSNNISGVQGGGIHTTRQILMNNNSQIDGNRALTNGGGIHLTGTGILETSDNASISNNVAGGIGGGINNGGTVTLNGSTVIGGNRLGTYSYVCDVDYDEYYYDECPTELVLTFTPGGTTGGGIHNSATLTVNDNTAISNNIATTSGGGIHTTGTAAAPATLSLNNNAQIIDNIAGTTGGGIGGFGAGSPITIGDDVQILRNHATTTGGGIHSTNILAIAGNALISHNIAGIECDEPDPNVNPEDLICPINIPGSGGGINLTTAGTLNLSGNVIISYNRAIGVTGDANQGANQGGFGGGIVSPSPTTIRDNVHIYNNYANMSGGGIHTLGEGANPGTPFIQLTDNVIIEANVARFAGGGINTNRSVVITDDVAILDNIAGTNGGGINVSQVASILTINNNVRIIGNLASGSYNDLGVLQNGTGGGINAMIVNIYDSVEIAENHVGLHGGGINATTINLNDNPTIHGNTANSNGGGIRSVGGPITFAANVQTIRIFDNTAGISGGGITTNAPLHINENVIIEQNKAGNSGGGVHVSGNQSQQLFALLMTDNALIRNNNAGVPCVTNCAINRTGLGGGAHVTDSAGISFMTNQARVTGNHAHGVTGDANLGSAGGTGGGLHITGHLVMDDDALVDSNTSGHFGGGLRAANGLTMLGASIVELNDSATSGGGASVSGTGLGDPGDDDDDDLYCWIDDYTGEEECAEEPLYYNIQIVSTNLNLRNTPNAGTLITDNAQIRNNFANATGGGLHANGSNVVTIEGEATIHHNTAGVVCLGDTCPGNRPGNGGGVANTGNAGMTYLRGNARVHNNEALGAEANPNVSGGGGNGGGLTIGHFIMAENAVVYGNFANESGGGVRIAPVYAGRAIAYMRDNAIVRDNSARVSGGGIGVTSGDFTMEDEALVINNEADNAGGMAVTHTALVRMLNNSRIEDNRAASGGAVGVLNTQSRFNMYDNSLIYNNFAHGSGVEGVGGGIANVGTVIINDRAQILENESNLQGGGIQVAPNATLILQGDRDFRTIYRNHARTSGGGLAVAGRAELRSGIIKSNTANSNGGAVNVMSQGTFYMPSGIIVGNHGCGTSENTGFGGGISFTGVLRIGESMILSDNQSFETLDYIGQTLYAEEEVEIPDGFVCEILNVDISDIDPFDEEPLIIRNVAGSGGGGVSALRHDQYMTTDGGRGFMTRGRIAENTALSTFGIAGGGGINLQLQRTFFTLTGGLVDNNEAVLNANGQGGHGGAVRSLLGHFTMDGDAIIENNHADGHGGGINSGGENPGSTVNLFSGTIRDNIAMRYGGGVFVGSRGTLTTGGTANEMLITNNEAVRGGGITVYGTHMITDFHATATINPNTTISHNEAQLDGGGIYVLGRNVLTLNGGQLLNNTAGASGGGVRLAFFAQMIMNDGLIAQNRAISAGGGGVSMPGSAGNQSTFNMYGGTITENDARFGGGIAFSAATNWFLIYDALNRLTITDTGTTVRNNTADDLHNGLQMFNANQRGTTNPGNAQIRPTYHDTIQRDAHFINQPEFGLLGTARQGYNDFSLNNYDIHVLERSVEVRFAAVGPGFLRPGNRRFTVGFGETYGGSHETPQPVPLIPQESDDPNEPSYCYLEFWTSSSPFHWINENPDTRFTHFINEYDLADYHWLAGLPQIEDLVIVEDTVFTAHFRCYPEHVIVEFEAPGGTLHDPVTDVEEADYEFMLAVRPGRTVSTGQRVPNAHPNVIYNEVGEPIECHFDFWTSDNPDHWIGGDEDTAFFDEAEIRELNIYRDTLFTAHFDCGDIEIIVDFDIYEPGGLLINHVTGNSYNEDQFDEFDITMRPLRRIASDEIIPEARLGTRDFIGWTSSDPSHWMPSDLYPNGDPNTMFTEAEIRQLGIIRNTTFTAFFEHPTGIPFRFRKFNDYLYLDLDADYPTHENLEPLLGAVFTLQRCIQNCETSESYIWSEVIATGESDAQGWVELRNEADDEILLTPSGVYRLVETVAPTGFNLPHGYWLLTWDADAEQFNFQARGTLSLVPAFRTVTTEADEAQTHHYYLGNFPLTILPDTGGLGGFGLLLIGALILAAVAMLYIRNNEKEKLE